MLHSFYNIHLKQISYILKDVAQNNVTVEDLPNRLSSGLKRNISLNHSDKIRE